VLKEMFRPEFLNRVDETIVFHELSRSEIRSIVDLMLAEVLASMAEKGLSFVVTDPVKDLLAEKGYDPKYGARPLRKTIQRLLEDPLSDLLLAGELKGKLAVSADLKEGKIVFDFL
jgi:ATP-dependent Clp protease ATP-binding subunit ClpA